MNFTELGNALKKVNKDRILQQMVRDNKERIVYLNKKQLLKGEKQDGTKIGTYLPYTVMKRLEKGRQVNFIDLYYEGNFQDKMFTEVRGLDYLIWSKDWKADMLVDKYGESILGLSEESKTKFMTDEGVSYITRSISRITGLKTVAA